MRDFVLVLLYFVVHMNELGVVDVKVVNVAYNNCVRCIGDVNDLYSAWKNIVLRDRGVRAEDVVLDEGDGTSGIWVGMWVGEMLV